MAEVSYCNYRSHTLRDLASTENRSSSTVRTWNKAKRHAGASVDWLFSLDIQTYVQIAWPWAWCSKPIDSPKRNWSAHAPTIAFAFNLYFRPPPMDPPRAYRALEHVTATGRSNTSGHFGHLLPPCWHSIDGQGVRNRHCRSVGHSRHIDIQRCGRAHGDSKVGSRGSWIGSGEDR